MINGGILKPIFPYFANLIILKPDSPHIKLAMYIINHFHETMIIFMVSTMRRKQKN